MSIHVYYREWGNHVHCRVFTARSSELTHAKAGDLTFDMGEWAAVKASLFSNAVLINEKQATLTAGGSLLGRVHSP